MKTSLYAFVLGLVFLGGCQNQTTEQARGVAADTTDATNNEATATPPSPEAEKALVDTSSLLVYNLTVSDIRVGNKVNESLSFEVDGRAGYVSFNICPLDDTGTPCPPSLVGTPMCGPGGECFPIVSGNSDRVSFTTIFPGSVSITGRACVDVAQSKNGEPCGPIKEYRHASKHFNARLASLYAEAQRLKQDLGRINSVDYRGALAKYVEDAEKCTQVNAEVLKIINAKSDIIKNYIRAPIATFQQAGEDIADTILGKEVQGKLLGAVDSVASEGKKILEQQCRQMNEVVGSEKACEILTQMGGTVKGMLFGMSPVGALGILSDALHTVYYGTLTGQADKLVPLACHAEKNLELSTRLIEQAMLIKIDLLKQLQAQILEASR